VGVFNLNYSITDSFACYRNYIMEINSILPIVNEIDGYCNSGNHPGTGFTLPQYIPREIFISNPNSFEYQYLLGFNLNDHQRHIVFFFQWVAEIIEHCEHRLQDLPSRLPGARTNHIPVTAFAEHLAAGVPGFPNSIGAD
jgi:hypothetical protein